MELEVDVGNVGSSLKAAVFDLNRADTDSSRASGGEPVGCVDDAGCDALVQLPFTAERSDWGRGSSQLRLDIATIVLSVPLGLSHRLLGATSTSSGGVSSSPSIACRKWSDAPLGDKSGKMLLSRICELATIFAADDLPSFAKSCRSEMMRSVSATALGYQAATCRAIVGGASSGISSRSLRRWILGARDTAGQCDH